MIVHVINIRIAEFINSVVKKFQDKLEGTLLSQRIETKFSNLEGSIIMPAYAKWADQGRRPGKQPPFNPSPLEDWMRRKGIPKTKLYPISKKIGLKGTKGRHFIKIFEEDAEQFIENVRIDLLKFPFIKFKRV